MGKRLHRSGRIIAQSAPSRNNTMQTDAEIVEAMARAFREEENANWVLNLGLDGDVIRLAQAALAAQRAMELVLVPVDMWKLEAVKDAYAQFLADAGLKNAPSLEHLLPRLIAAAQGEMK
jgi:hypothetical protein